MDDKQIEKLLKVLNRIAKALEKQNEVLEEATKKNG